jgi:MOSC domain-containing protein YiiM
MRLVSVNISTPREIGASRGKPVFSAILKKPVQGPVSVRWANLEGDRQADPAVHGGERKAVYAYPAEHYEYWRKKFPDMDLPWGSLGENLTTEGLLEVAVHSGDVFEIGTAQLAVTQPRLPCFKLGIRFGTATIIKTFLESERTGFYLQVLREGQIRAGDEIKQVSASPGSETITQMVRAAKKRQP